MGLTNHGIINLHNNKVDGLHIDKGGEVENFNEINSHDNGRHGILVADDIATLRANIEQASALLDKENLRSLREELQPLFAKVKQDLEAPQINMAGAKNTLSNILANLPGIGQGIIGNVIYNQLPDFHQLHDLLNASLQMLLQS